jgi:Tol biopolymer transport system component
VVEDDAIEYVDSWSPDGRYLAYGRAVPGKPGWDIWVVPLVGDRRPVPVIEGPSNKENPSFSPDGKWLAYDSDESGSWEVYVVPFPRAQGRWQVSSGGGTQPRWSGDGKELFFVAPTNRLVTAAIEENGASLKVGSPQALFQASFAPSAFRNYDLTRDGQKFVLVTQPAETGAHAITLVVNWPALMAR